MNKRIKKIVSLFYTMVIALSIFFTANITGQASYTLSMTETISNHSSGDIIPMSDDIRWRYEIKEDGKLYKRLYNYTTRQWIGDWILVS